MECFGHDRTNVKKLICIMQLQTVIWLFIVLPCPERDENGSGENTNKNENHGGQGGAGVEMFQGKDAAQAGILHTDFYW